jgi:aryl-alcohol dehydrogenase-like predicted oxidoreductase
MEYRPLGKSWIEASVVSFGAWAIGGSGFQPNSLDFVSSSGGLNDSERNSDYGTDG